jgi:hypothetical protein
MNDLVPVVTRGRSRLFPSIRKAQKSINRKTSQIYNKYCDVDEYLNTQECWFCLGSEGPITKANCAISLCRHTRHHLCASNARNVVVAHLIDAHRRASATREAMANGEAPPSLDGLVELSEVTHGMRCGICREAIVCKGIVSGRPLDKVNLLNCFYSNETMLKETTTVQLLKLQFIDQTYMNMRDIIKGEYTKHFDEEDDDNEGCAGG